MSTFFLHLLACFAEKERRQVSERTRTALSAPKNRKFFETMRTEFERSLADAGSYSGAAGLLNGRGVVAYKGGRWYPQTVKNYTDNLGLPKLVVRNGITLRGDCTLVPKLFEIEEITPFWPSGCSALEQLTNAGVQVLSPCRKYQPLEGNSYATTTEGSYVRFLVWCRVLVSCRVKANGSNICRVWTAKDTHAASFCVTPVCHTALMLAIQLYC